MELRKALIEAGYEPVYTPAHDMRHVDKRPEDIKIMELVLREAHEWADVVEACDVIY